MTIYGTKYSRLGLWLALVCVSAAGYAEVTVRDHTEHYLIHGSSETALRNEMNANGPLGKDGRRYHASTQWDIGWRFSLDRSVERCAIGSVAVEVKLSFIMPRWGNDEAGAASVKTNWREYLAGLEEHENGHKKNGLDAAHEIERGIMALPPQETCDTLVAAANALATGIIKNHQLRDIEYDRVTNHGRASGGGFR